MRCEICGKEAPYFTETYDPMEGKARTIYLCEEHQKKMYMRIVDAMLYMGSERLNEYKKGILKLPEITDADKEAIHKVLETTNKTVPIIQVHPVDHAIRDIGKVLEWLYYRGIPIHGMDEEVEELLRNIVKEGE